MLEKWYKLTMKVKIIIIFIIIFNPILVANSAQKTIPFNLRTVKNKIVPIDSLLQNGPVLITFWALWCKPCKEKLQALKRLKDEYPFKEITIVAVNEDTPRSFSKVINYVTSHKLPFLFCLDPNQKLLHQFNAWGIPFTVFLNKKREIVIKHLGYVPGDEKNLQKKIEKYLGNDK